MCGYSCSLWDKALEKQFAKMATSLESATEVGKTPLTSKSSKRSGYAAVFAHCEQAQGWHGPPSHDGGLYPLPPSKHCMHGKMKVWEVWGN